MRAASVFFLSMCFVYVKIFRFINSYIILSLIYFFILRRTLINSIYIQDNRCKSSP